ncbi:MAG: ABC transporter permease [Gemmatimonadetes bacterium]|nr:ABC transporter permease [Gemmatimonadota bacterium]
MTMHWPRRAFRLPWRKPDEIDAELDEEFAFHLEARARELEAGGMAPAAAREEARRRFGDLDGARAYIRAVDRGTARVERRRDWWTGWRQDLRFAARQLARTPGFTLIAVLTIALGVGANTAIFSAVHRLLVDPLPFPGGDRLVALLESSRKTGTMISPFGEVLAQWRGEARSFEGIELFTEREVAVGEPGAEPERLGAALISPTLPRFLGITLPLGRGFTADEAIPNGPRVVILGHGLWQRRFGGRRDVLGQALPIEGVPHTVVGVMPRDLSLPFMQPGPARQLWLPLPPPADADRPQAMARLRPGVTPEMASAELERIEDAHAGGRQQLIDFRGKAVRPQEFMPEPLREGLLILFGVVGVVLLIACANVANLLLARAATRSHEFAVRTALGAGRGRLVRQLLTESTLLALLGGLLGVALAWQGLELLRLVRPAMLSPLDDVRLAPVALGWSLGLTLLTGLVFGLAPALLATDRRLADPLRLSAGSTRRGSTRLRTALVIAEVALSVALLVGAGLLVRTLRELQRVDVGYPAAGITAVTLALPQAAGAPGAPAPPLDPLLEGLLQRVRALPGVTGAAYASGLPPQTGIAMGRLDIEGKPSLGDAAPRAVGFTSVDPAYFAVLGLPLLAGRTFQQTGTAPEMVINASMARRYWPGEDPIGRRYRIGDQGSWLTVVGVVPDVRLPARGGALDSLQMYTARGGAAEDFGQVYLVVRSSGDAALLAPLRAAVAAAGGGIGLQRLETMPARLDQVLAGPRFTMRLFAGFAALALLLATIGLYGVVSYSVSQRTREIGVRIALGAGRGAVLGMVLLQALGLATGGVLLGLLAAAAGTRAMASMLYQVSPLDPLTFGAVALVLVAVALLAAWVPARRALRVDPVVALKGE